METGLATPIVLFILDGARLAASLGWSILLQMPAHLFEIVRVVGWVLAAPVAAIVIFHPDWQGNYPVRIIISGKPLDSGCRLVNVLKPIILETTSAGQIFQALDSVAGGILHEAVVNFFARAVVHPDDSGVFDRPSQPKFSSLV